MARMIDVLNRDEKAAQRRTKKAVAELAFALAELKAAKAKAEVIVNEAKEEAKKLFDNQQITARNIESLRGERRKLDGEIATLSKAVDAIKRNEARTASFDHQDAESLYAVMKPELYGIAIYRVKSANYDRHFLKMKWGNLSRIIAEGDGDAVCKVAEDIRKLIAPQGAPLRVKLISNKQDLWTD